MLYHADNYCTWTEDATHYTVSGKCIVTGKDCNVKVPKEAINAYRKGALIQDAMSMLNRDDREFLLSGHSPEGWEIIFGKGDEEEDEE